MMKDAMSEALARKKAMGLDITILIGEPKPMDMPEGEEVPGELGGNEIEDQMPEGEQEKLGLAPNAQPVQLGEGEEGTEIEMPDKRGLPKSKMLRKK